jgi:hypothetical protein
MKKSTDKPSLWNNDMVNNALKSMSPKDLQHYKKLGESLYKDLDFETSKVKNDANLPPFMTDAIAYLVETLKSGLHPSMLEPEDKKLLEEVYGDEWYKKWGYVEGDLTDIVTIKME